MPKMLDSPQRSDRVRKRDPVRKKPKTAREKFAARLRELAGDRTSVELAKEWGVSGGAVRQWLRGDTIPDIDHWVKIASYFGFSDYREMLPENL